MMTSYMNRMHANRVNPCSPLIEHCFRIPIDLMWLRRWNCTHRRRRTMHCIASSGMILAVYRNCNLRTSCDKIGKVFPLSFRHYP